MRTLGIDYGDKKIGIAISDEDGNFATPLDVLQNNKDIVKRIKHICNEKNVTVIVIGESLDYKNRPNPIMSDIRNFKGKLENEMGVPVIFQKETLTTKEAERIQGRNKNTDASAAALILRSYLDNK
jgi:putative Holliday junction resolvase